MSSRPKTKGPTLFAAGGLDRDAPRPLADEMRLDPQTEGVVITGVTDGSAAQSVGFQKGDIIVSVNGQNIAKSSELERVTNAGSRSWRITIQRGGQQISVMFSG